MAIDLLAVPVEVSAFILSVTCHEAAHAYVAWRGGDNTAYVEGLVTLNPVVHARREPIGMVVAPLIGLLSGGYLIGWGSCPYDPHWQSHYPKRAALMAVAGPAANLLLVILAAALIHLGIAAGVFSAPNNLSGRHLVDTNLAVLEGVALFLSALFMNNIILFVFNLLPCPPLDGAAALGLFFNEKIAEKLSEFRSDPQFAFIGLFIAWKLMGLLGQPVFNIAIKVLYPTEYYY